MMTLFPDSNDTITITSSQVHCQAANVLGETFDQLTINGYDYTQNQVWDVLLYASVNRISIKSACEALEASPSYNWVYTIVNQHLFETYSLSLLEEQANDALSKTFPKWVNKSRQKVAIDLVLIPFYGNLATEGIYRSAAKAGTTKFFCYASAYLIKKNKRVTLTMTYVRGDDTLLSVLKRLLCRIDALGIGLKRLYLDRGFAQVDVLSHLDAKPYVSVVALPKRGNRMKELQTGKKSRIVEYTMRSHRHGEITFSLWIACRYRKGRAKKHGVAYLFFAVLGKCKSPILQVASEYRHRFGIEASYRIMNRNRAITTSKNPSLRLLLVAIAFLLSNIWVYLKWNLTLLSRRKHNKMPGFTQNLFCLFISEAIKDIYQVVCRIKL